MLNQRYPIQNLNLPSQAEWKPYPLASERAKWEALPISIREVLIKVGESALHTSWNPLLATQFLEFERMGNRSNYEAAYFARRNKLIWLALAECAEGQGRFVDEIINGLWLICEETYWGLPAHVGMQQSGVGLPDVNEPTVDLFAAETAAALAYIYYLLGDALDDISPLIRSRIADEIQRRILMPNLLRDDFNWMGFSAAWHANNWNPWINSNWLACVMFIESDSARRLEATDKIMRSLDRFIDQYPTDGGCDEGPAYWMRAAGSLYECLEQLHLATNGEIDVFDELRIQEMGCFIYRVHIDEGFYINFADSSAILNPESTLIYCYGRSIKDQDMMAFGAWAAQTNPSGEADGWGRPIQSPMRLLRSIFMATEIGKAEAYAPKPRDVWLPVVEVMVSRDQAQSSEGFYVAVKGGHNDESHNHNDIGAFIVFIDGKPLLIDIGVETYNRETFSPQRYDIWTMQSAYHNLPTINGVQQQPGKEFAAKSVKYTATTELAEMSLDLASAYPPEVGINYWIRTIRHHRKQSVVVEDAYELDDTPQNLVLSLITVSEALLDKAGSIQLFPRMLPDQRMSGKGVIYYDAGQLVPSLETITTSDPRINGVWGTTLYRILLNVKTLRKRDTWKLELLD